MACFIDSGFCGVEFGMGRSGAATHGLIVAFQRKKTALFGAKATFPGFIEPDRKSSDLVERAEIAAKQMRYFGLIAQKSSFSELLPSAKRAGFALLSEDPERIEAVFQWATGEPDFIFSVSFEHPDRVSVIAESCRDIFGLVLVSHSHVPNISVETKPSLGNQELGRNALRFRDRLLIYPDFDRMPAWTKY
jgi:hypothetical protein